ncbi:MAG: hypothetical protein WC899_03935 [bacterium]|jgi:hypothetical protein
MKDNFYKTLVASSLVLSLFIYGNLCFAEQTSYVNIDNAIKLYENGYYNSADNMISIALKKDKRDVAALTWYALIKMEISKNSREINHIYNRSIVDKLILYLNTYYGSDLLFLDEDKLYSYYHAAYAKAYWLTNNNKEVDWFVEKSLALYQYNYEALHIKGQVALGRVDNPPPPMFTSNYNDPPSRDSYLSEAYKSFLAELAAAENDAPEIRSRAAYWAAATLYKANNNNTDKINELLGISIKANPIGIYGVLSKKMLDKILNVK